MKGLLNKNKFDRFTVEDVFVHEYFRTFNFSGLLDKSIFSPLKPYIEYFDLDKKIEESMRERRRHSYNLSPINNLLGFEKIVDLMV